MWDFIWSIIMTIIQTILGILGNLGINIPV